MLKGLFRRTTYFFYLKKTLFRTAFAAPPPQFKKPRPPTYMPPHFKNPGEKRAKDPLQKPIFGNTVPPSPIEKISKLMMPRKNQQMPFPTSKRLTLPQPPHNSLTYVDRVLPFGYKHHFNISDRPGSYPPTIMGRRQMQVITNLEKNQYHFVEW